MIEQHAKTLQADLLKVFKIHNVSVGVALTRYGDRGSSGWGVSLMSQHPAVDCSNAGPIQNFTEAQDGEGAKRYAGTDEPGDGHDNFQGHLYRMVSPVTNEQVEKRTNLSFEEACRLVPVATQRQRELFARVINTYVSWGDPPG